MVPEMLAVGAGVVFAGFSGRLGSKANPLGLAKMCTAVEPEGHGGHEENLHDSFLPD